MRCIRIRNHRRSRVFEIDGIKYIFDADYGVVGMEYTVQSEYGGKGRQQALLEADGIEVIDGKVNLQKYGITLSQED